MNEIEELYNNACEIYGEDRIVFASIITEVNFLASTPFVFVLPTEEELYLSTITNYRQDTYLDFREFFGRVKMLGSAGNYAAIAFPQAVFNKKYKEILLKNIIYNKEKKIDSKSIASLSVADSDRENNILKKNIIDIYHLYLDKDKKKEEIKLTKTEKKAMKSILEEFNYQLEGDISVSQLITKYKISRPVYINLFYKLKENEYANITNKGMNGTHIIFNQDIDIEMLID